MIISSGAMEEIGADLVEYGDYTDQVSGKVMVE